MQARKCFWVGIALLSSAFFLSVQAQDTNAAKLIWLAKLPGIKTESSPALAPDGTVYQGTFNGWMLAFSSVGKVQWQFKTGLEIKSSPAVGDDGTIYFGSRDRNLYALTTAGKMKWKFATGGWVDSSPALAENGTIYFGSNDKNFYALTVDGKLKWKFDANGMISSSPAIAADGTIYFGSHDKNFYALTPEGKLKWKFTTHGAIDASPTLAADGTIYFSSSDGFLYALAADGSQRWRVQTFGNTGSTAVLDEDGNLYLTADRDFYFVNPAGKIIFHTPGEVKIDASGALTANREVLFSIPWLRIGSFNLDHNWPPSWTFSLSDNLACSPNVDNEGVIYAVSGLGLFAIQPPHAAPPAKSSWPLWRGNQQQNGRANKLF